MTEETRPAAAISGKNESDEWLKAEKEEIAQYVQELLAKKLRAHEISVERAKEIARKVVEELKGVQSHEEIRSVIPKLAKEFDELREILERQDRIRKEEVDRKVAAFVEKLIKEGKFKEAVEISTEDLSAYRGQDDVNLDVLEKKLDQKYETIEQAPPAGAAPNTAADVKPEEPEQQIDRTLFEKGAPTTNKELEKKIEEKVRASVSPVTPADQAERSHPIPVEGKITPFTSEEEGVKAFPQHAPPPPPTVKSKEAEPTFQAGAPAEGEKRKPDWQKQAGDIAEETKIVVGELAKKVGDQTKLGLTKLKQKWKDFRRKKEEESEF